MTAGAARPLIQSQMWAPNKSPMQEPAGALMTDLRACRQCQRAKCSCSLTVPGAIGEAGALWPVTRLCARCDRLGLECTPCPPRKRACACCRAVKARCTWNGTGARCDRCTRCDLECVYKLTKQRGVKGPLGVPGAWAGGSRGVFGGLARPLMEPLYKLPLGNRYLKSLWTPSHTTPADPRCSPAPAGGRGCRCCSDHWKRCHRPRDRGCAHHPHGRRERQPAAPSRCSTRPSPPGRLSGLPAFPILNRFCMALLYGRARRLTAQNGCFRPGQISEATAVVVTLAEGEFAITCCYSSARA